MRVSLVTPVYNQAEYLSATIESVLGQDYGDLEYLVIDDGSSDDSLAVARRYEQAYPGRLRVLTQANAGQAATLNRGWRMAEGELLAYLSSDDCLRPGAVRRAVETLLAHPDAVVAYCDYELIDAQGRVTRQVRAQDYDAIRLRADLVCQPGPGAFFRRETFAFLQGWRGDLRQVPDFEFWLRASRHGSFVRIADCLAQYRVHEDSASFKVMSVERAEEIVRVMEGFWRDEPAAGDLASRSMSRAWILAAKNHFQSRRFGAGLRSLGTAARIWPPCLARADLYRALAAGALRRWIYAWRTSVQRDASAA